MTLAEETLSGQLQDGVDHTVPPYTAVVLTLSADGQVVTDGGDGSAADGSDGGTNDGAVDDGSTEDGSVDDGSVDDGSSDDGSTEDGGDTAGDGGAGDGDDENGDAGSINGSCDCASSGSGPIAAGPWLLLALGLFFLGRRRGQP